VEGPSAEPARELRARADAELCVDRLVIGDIDNGQTYSYQEL
jgi:hypothetical protein